MSMRKIILALLLLFLSPSDVSPEFYFASWEASGTSGMAFVLPNEDCLIFSKGEGSGIHEIGHCVNFWRGYPSETPEFEQATIAYLDRCEVEEQPCWRIGYFYEQGQLSEVYAELYMWNMLYELPKEFIDFY